MLDWRAVDTVLLDMDGTLLDLHFDSYFWLEHLPIRYAQLHRLAPEDAREWLHQRIIQEQGTLNWYCLDYWSEQLGVDIPALKREVADRIGFRPQVQDFLQRLRQRDVRSVIVTNAHRDSLSLKLQVTGLDTLVDAIICSHDFQLPKEDVRFWSLLQEIEPFNPDRTLLVDDSLAVLRSAERYGIAHLLSISRPDSQAPARSTDDFRAVDQFDELFKDGDHHDE